MNKIAGFIGSILGFVLFVTALFVLHNELKTYSITDIFRHIEQLPLHIILSASALTILSYLTLTGYDTLALKYIENDLHYTKIAFASFCGYAVSNNIGLSLISGGSVRYRLYSSWGISTFDITKIIAFCSLTLWIGFIAVCGAVFTAHSIAIPKTFHLPVSSGRIIGIICLSITIIYILLSIFKREPIVIKNWSFPIPHLRTVIAQIAVASLDWILAGSVLFILLPDNSGLKWPVFMGMYLLAQLAGIISQLPGGIGVFEALMIVMLPPEIKSSQIFSSLIVYRGIYYILPLLLASFLIGAQEITARRSTVQKLVTIFGKWSTALVPQILALGIFISGTILLFSISTPAVGWRLKIVDIFLPLPVIELSHFLGSLTGVGLLILSRSIYRRIDAAYFFAAGLLAFGIIFSLLKGFDYEEAIILTIILGTLLPCRKYFYRKSYVGTRGYTFQWASLILLVLLLSLWIGLFSFKHVEYSHSLWWNFAVHAESSRFMRGIMGALLMTLTWGFMKLLSSPPPEPPALKNEDLMLIDEIVKKSPFSNSNLAYLRDKLFIFSPARNSFIMYAIEGKSWIAMGDPVGKKEEWPELIWSFRELCDRHNGWTVFYEIRPENLHYYLELGLTFLKMGEEARVPLTNFTLESSERKGLRYTYRKLEKEGCNFEIIPKEDIHSYIHDLNEVSDDWLSSKNTHEKKFSLGNFDENYLENFALGIIRYNGNIIAFANIWESAENEEISIDLMRYHRNSPNSVMEYLFINLMLWGKEKGYRWFNLGMAPLSGVESYEFAPLWNRVASFIYTHGEQFYNLQGLKTYKGKFNPVWQPKYLAAPGGFAVPQILTNIAAVTSGGIKGVITK